MPEPGQQKKEGLFGRLVTEIIAIIPSDLKEMIGTQVGIYLFAFMPIILISGVIWVVHVAKTPKPPEVSCWQIQKIDSRLFKLNTCTGETAELTTKEPASQERKTTEK